MNDPKQLELTLCLNHGESRENQGSRDDIAGQRHMVRLDEIRYEKARSILMGQLNRSGILNVNIK